MAPKKRQPLSKADQKKSQEARRGSFHLDPVASATQMRRCSIEMTTDERKAWEAKRTRGLQVVKEAMKMRDNALLFKHALRSFGVAHTVALVHCTESGEQRKLVTMSDSFTYKELVPWVKHVLYGAQEPKGSISMHYLTETGTTLPISNGLEFDTWRDLYWYKHPPEMFVSDSGGLLAKANLKWSAAQELFNMYDTDGNGKIDLREMLMAKQMTKILDVHHDDVQSFLKDLFHTSDVNKDHAVSFPEFIQYYNRLNESMREGILRESRPVYRAARLKSNILSAQSWRRTLSQVASSKAVELDDAAKAVDLSRHFGWLKCDANVLRNYAVGLRIPHACVSDANQHRWVEVSTWSEELVDGFTDMTGRMGEPMSPLVVVEFEMGTGADLPSDASHDYYMQKAAEANQCVEDEDGHERVIGTHETGRQLPAAAELYLPHAFAERGRIAELCEWRYLEKKDVIVVRAVIGDDCWIQVPETDFDLLPAAEGMGGMPGLRIRIDRGGIYAVYSVLHSIAHQRVLALTFVSGHVIPLDPLSVKLWLVPDLPNMIDSVMYQEQARSGLVVLAGWSTKPLNATPGRTKVGLTMKDDNDPEDPPRHRNLLWTGEPCSVEFNVHPDDWWDEVKTEQGVMQEIYNIHMHFEDMRGGHSVYRAAADLPEHTADFKCKIVAHNFPPPSAPVELRVHARTNSNTVLKWEAPEFWGGCAISHYELQCALLDQAAYTSGKYDDPNWEELCSVKWVNGEPPKSTSSARSLIGSVPANVWAGKFRVRAYNCASNYPGEWSELVMLHPEKVQRELDDAKPASSRPPTSVAKERPRSREGGEGAAKKGKPRAADKGAAAEEDMMAIVNDEDEEFTATKKQLLDGSKRWEWTAGNPAAMRNWSPFCRTLGRFFLEAGVKRGAQGELFGLSPQKVEKLTMAEQAHREEQHFAEYITEDQPLAALACTSVWVMQTLSHHVENIDDWVPLLQDFDGLLQLAAHECVGELKPNGDPQCLELSTERELKSIVHTLVEAFETLRQCEPGGVIVSQLGNRYSKDTRRTLRKEFEEQLEKMRTTIGNQVMAMSEKNAIFTGKPLSSNLLMLQNALGDTRAPMPGALKFKVGYFESFLEYASDHGEHLKEVNFTSVAAHNLPCKKGLASGSLRNLLEGEVRKVTFTLGIDGHCSESVLNGSHLINPVWQNQRVQFKLPDGAAVKALPKPLPVHIEVVDGQGEVLGQADVMIDEPFGMQTVTLDATTSSKYQPLATSQTNAAIQPTTVTFNYRIGAWTTQADIPPELTAEVSGSPRNYSKLLKTCSLEAASP